MAGEGGTTTLGSLGFQVKADIGPFTQSMSAAKSIAQTVAADIKRTVDSMRPRQLVNPEGLGAAAELARRATEAAEAVKGVDESLKNLEKQQRKTSAAVEEANKVLKSTFGARVLTHGITEIANALGGVGGAAMTAAADVARGFLMGGVAGAAFTVFSAVVAHLIELFEIGRRSAEEMAKAAADGSKGAATEIAAYSAQVDVIAEKWRAIAEMQKSGSSEGVSSLRLQLTGSEAFGKTLQATVDRKEQDRKSAEADVIRFGSASPMFGGSMEKFEGARTAAADATRQRDLYAEQLKVNAAQQNAIAAQLHMATTLEEDTNKLEGFNRKFAELGKMTTDASKWSPAAKSQMDVLLDGFYGSLRDQVEAMKPHSDSAKDGMARLVEKIDQLRDHGERAWKALGAIPSKIFGAQYGPPQPSEYTEAGSGKAMQMQMPAGIKAIRDLAEHLPAGLQRFATMLEATTNGLKQMENVLSSAVSNTHQFASGLDPALGSIVDTVTNVTTDIVASGGDFTAAIGSLASGMMSLVTGLIMRSHAYQMLMQKLEPVIQAVAEALGRLLAEVAAGVSAGMAFWQDIISGKFSQAGDDFKAVFNATYSDYMTGKIKAFGDALGAATANVPTGFRVALYEYAASAAGPRPHASGGIVSRPTRMDVVGEAGPEAVIPLDSPQARQHLGGIGLQIGTVVVYANNPDQMARELQAIARRSSMAKYGTIHPTAPPHIGR